MSRVHNLQLEDRNSGVCAVDISSQTEPCEADDRSNRQPKQLSRRFIPILWLMKVSGQYYGDFAWDEVTEVNSSVLLTRFYCAMVLLGQLVIFLQAATSLFFEGFAQMQTFYFLMIFSVWYLQCAAFNTICLNVLPRRQKRTSSLGHFVSNLISVSSDVGDIKMCKVNLAMAFACGFGVFNTLVNVALDFFRHSSVGRFRPWNGFLAYRLIHFLFGAFDSFAWALPFALFYVSCELIVRIFEDLEKKVSTTSPNFNNIERLRVEHHHLCGTVALADKVFSSLLLVAVIFDVPLICINFHQLVKSPLSDVMYIVSVFYWGIALVGRLAFVMRSAVRVNDKIHGFYDTLQNISVVDCQQQLELLRFLIHLRGEPIGLSIGGLVVIDKSFALSLVGIIISYFAVLVTLPS